MYNNILKSEKDRKTKEMETPIDIRAEILSQVWVDFRNDVEFEEFVAYNDLGLPLAYAFNAGLATITPKGIDIINETFDLLVEATGHEEDIGFKTIYEIIDSAAPLISQDYIDGISDDDEDEEGEEEEFPDTGEQLSDGGEYREGYGNGYEAGWKAGGDAEQKRVQAIAQMNMKWAKQQNKGNEFMQWHNVSEILKPVVIDPNFDDEDF